MNIIATSLQRGTFSIECEKKRMAEKPEDAEVQERASEMIEYYEEFNLRERNKEQDPEWQKNNLEYDLRSTQWIIDKCKVDKYAQNVYAALCNVTWIKNEIIPVLRDEEWGCSWRYAGGIIAHLRGEGDYVDWYCSGIGPSDESGFVSEGTVTEEIEQDFAKLGWYKFKEY